MKLAGLPFSNITLVLGVFIFYPNVNQYVSISFSMLCKELEFVVIITWSSAYRIKDNLSSFMMKISSRSVYIFLIKWFTNIMNRSDELTLLLFGKSLSHDYALVHYIWQIPAQLHTIVYIAFTILVLSFCDISFSQRSERLILSRHY